MKVTEEIKQLLMQKGFGTEGATIAAEHLVANGVTILSEHDLCMDNVMCCDDNCQACAKRIYKAYCRVHEELEEMSKNYQ